jgi:hypothetical protein
MSSWVGRSIAHYRVTARIGVGGMGEVYRASDSRLGRDVAIKVLPPEFAQDPERMARFEREAKLLASLSHAGIAGIYGLEETDGTCALVMELVEGPTLEERIARGAMPPEEACPVAKQIADALECAHERGIIHRDLKPANVKVTPGAGVKVLDFGLAKALLGDPSAPGADPSRSPTITAASTQSGVILGTAAYMSPEQAKGRAVDRRADIWAFGAVLFEMLSGRQAFAGETVSETLASVMKDEPDWSALPSSTPARVRDLLRRCLVKDPRQRLRDIGDARIRLEEEIAGVPDASAAPGAGAPSAPMKRRGLPVLPAALVSLAAVAIGLFAGISLRAPTEPPLYQATLVFPEGMALDRQNVSLAISPDGTSLAVAAAAAGESPRIWVRRFDRPEAVPIEGTDGATYPFWSPDGRDIGFFADRKLKRVPATGGVVQTLCDAADGRGASWGSLGTIAFSPGPLDGLHIVPAGGGVPQPVTELDSSGMTHRLPSFLPDGERVLFVVGSSTLAQPVLECLDLKSKKRTRVMPTWSGVRYLEPGHLAFMLDENVFVQRFDERTLAVSGDPVPVAQAVQLNRYRYAASFDASSHGPLVYATDLATERSQPTWFDLDGRELGPLGEPAPIIQAALSPEGTRLLTSELTDRYDLWMWDLKTGVRTRFTFGPDPSSFPLWSRDGNEVYSGDGAGRIWVRRSDGASAPRELTDFRNRSAWPVAIAPGGEDLVFSVQDPVTGIDLRTVPRDGGGEPRDLLVAPGNQDFPRFSPDGRWMMFTSDESGRNEVVVVPYPSLSGRWQISSKGGGPSEWLPDGSGVLYSTPDGRLLHVALDTRGDGIVVGAERPLFGGKPLPGPWLIAPDGRRLLVAVPVGRNSTLALNFVSDWRSLIAARDVD